MIKFSIFKIFISFIISVFVFISFATVFAQEGKVEIQYFYGDNCANCKKAEAFFVQLKKEYPSVEIKSYEVFSDRQNAQILLQFLKSTGQEASIIRTPTIFIGGEVIIGYLNDETTGKLIADKTKAIIEGQKEDSSGANGEKDEIINYPIFGKINLSKLSLPVLTILVAALDGFNPCSMWVLIFMLVLLINASSRKRMVLIGAAFISTSAIFYYLILSAWLNLFLTIGYVNLTRIIIGLIAIGAGAWQMRSFIVSKPGVCEIAPVGGKLHQRLAQKTKQIVHSSALPAVVVGTVILAIGVNSIEFFCSAGLPAIYARILSLNHLHPLSYYLYLLLYDFIFMLDDLFVFGVALITFRKIATAEKYNKWSALVGGALLLILGILLIFRPDFLMFG